MSAETKTPLQRDAEVYLRVVREARPYWMHLAAICVLSLSAIPLALLAPLPLKIAVDTFIGSLPLPAALAAWLPAWMVASKTSLLLFATGLLVLIPLLQQAQAFGSWLLELYTGEKLVFDYRSRLFLHLQRMSLSYHNRKGVSDLLYAVQEDAPLMQYVSIHGAVPIATSTVTVLALIGASLRIDVQLALVSLAVAPALFYMVASYGRRIGHRWHKIRALDNDSFSIVEEALSLIRVVKAYGREEDETRRFADRAGASLREHMSVIFAEAAFGLTVSLVTALGTAGVLWIGMRHVQAGRLTLGELLVVLAYVGQLYKPLETISKKATQMKSSLASTERVFQLFDLQPEVLASPSAKPLGRARGEIVFEDVSFKYGERAVLSGVSFKIKPGSRVGVSGRTGAGKTTLLGLLPRFHDPVSGRIFLDGLDIKEADLADLRSQFAVAFQDSPLFSATIAENIAYGRPFADEWAIVEAARAANIHDAIMKLPDAYRTHVGAHGACLSGGERQRIALARAFLKDAPIILLDEPTSAIDAASESVIMDAIERLTRGRTTFIISHRQKMLERCDARLHVEQGAAVLLDAVA
ncbi:MAG: ABC transporter ATP-binding protein [Elusimicrobia bacterium]|nr:ABC transporter ATP-binding protein [Elusimicrobiota bacterium]